MSVTTSMDHNQGYIKCLEDLSAYFKARRRNVTFLELKKDFILPKMEIANNNIGTIGDEMYREYLKDHSEEKKP